MNLRESKGYAYYAFSGEDLFKNCGVFWVRARVTSEAVVPSVREILRELGPEAVGESPPSRSNRPNRS